MISFTCDKCERPLKVGEQWAGQKYECEHCGDVNRVPNPHRAEPGEDAERGDHPEAAGLPPDSGEERRVVFVRPVMMRARPILFLGLSVALLGGLAGVVWFGLAGKSPAWVLWPSALVAIVAIVGFVWWKLQTLSRGLDVTNKRATVIYGLFSKSTSEVLHDNIRNIQIYQSFWQRIWRVGAIGISSAGQDGVEVYIRDIPDPHDLRKTIDLYRPL